MPEFIVDTNVPLTASGLADQMLLSCQERCVELLDAIMNNEHVLVLDAGYHIISEYQNKMSSTQPSYARVFIKWIYNHLAKSQFIKQVPITSVGEYDFEEVPQSVVDIGFDNSDRKFIAVAMANGNNAPIAQAADSKWIGWEQTLANKGIQVHFLCRDELRVIFDRKQGGSN